jgi:hypothetical protein
MEVVEGEEMFGRLVDRAPTCCHDDGQNLQRRIRWTTSVEVTSSRTKCLRMAISDVDEFSFDKERSKDDRVDQEEEDESYSDSTTRTLRFTRRCDFSTPKAD